MMSVLETLPVALAIVVALTFALFFTRSLLHMLFQALGRLVASHQADAATK